MAAHPITDIIPLKEIKLVTVNPEYNFEIFQCIPEKGDYQLLITSGLSSRVQKVNEDNKDLARIELYMSLPDYWNFDDKTWPIEWLNKVAQVPQKYDTWFGAGDTIPAGSPPQPLDEKLAANHFILTRPIKHADGLSGEKWLGMPFQLLAVVPIFQEELDYKLKNSYTMLFNKFDKHEVTEHIDIYRTSIYKKRFFGMFG